MSNSIEHIDHSFAEVATNGSVSVPDHLEESIFSQLSREGFSKPAPSVASAETTSPIAKPFLTKGVAGVLLMTMTAGIFIGWQLSRVYYKEEEEIPPKNLAIPSVENSATPQAAVPLQSETTASEITPLSSTKDSYLGVANEKMPETKLADRTKVGEKKSIKVEVESIVPAGVPESLKLTEDHNAEGIHVDVGNQSRVEDITSDESSVVKDVTPVETPKSLLDQLKDKESRFNDNLFKE